MNEKEIAEIRRRYRPEKNNITHIRGCYVNDKREIISQFDQSMNLMPQEEAESILSILKKTLSGTLGKNLINITFDTQQVVNSEEHKRLMSLKNTALSDEATIQAFFQSVIEALALDESYMILLTHDKYDVPYRGKDDFKQDDASSEVFSYILCSICPIKSTKLALSYHLSDSQFHNCKQDWLVSAPELGFLFPAFDDRSANIYSSLYYTRNSAENHRELTDAIFKQDIPMSAAAQKEAFESILSDTLGEECSYEVVQAVHGQLCEMIETHKTNKEPEPLVISKGTVKNVLEACGVSNVHVTAFDEKYDTEFGSDTDLNPLNIVDVKQFELRTPDVTIHVNPERSDLIETRMIGGAQYILIRANEGVEVNGIAVCLS